MLLKDVSMWLNIALGIIYYLSLFHIHYHTPEQKLLQGVKLIEPQHLSS